MILSERKTVSDSKEIFHREFPFVIPPVYRRITDEILVELNLLTNQKNFSPDGIFSLGLRKAFHDLTKGYEPHSQLKGLFSALCCSAGLNSIEIERNADNLLIKLREQNLSDYGSTLNKLNINSNERRIIAKGKGLDNYHNRLLSIGLLNILEETIKDKDSQAESKLEELIGQLAESINLSPKRVEKDINSYKMNIEKLDKAIELFRLKAEEEKKKRA